MTAQSGRLRDGEGECTGTGEKGQGDRNENIGEGNNGVKEVRPSKAMNPGALWGRAGGRDFQGYRSWCIVGPGPGEVEME